MADFISGYAAVFNTETVIDGLFREKFLAGAFDRSLRENPDVLALWSHDWDRPLGRTSAGTLELRSDRAGLYFALTPDDTTPDGLTAIGTVRRQDVKGCSFSFTAMRETWVEGGDNELPLRIVEEARLYEVTLTPLPAYPETSAVLSQRSTTPAANRDAVRRAEAAMRLRGIS